VNLGGGVVFGWLWACGKRYEKERGNRWVAGVYICSNV
jgi:hypothetical protein